MASKIGLLLSLVIFVQAMLFAGDVLVYQISYTQLIAETIVVSRKIEHAQGVTEAVVNYVSERLHADVSCISGCEGERGDTLTYRVTKHHQPILDFLWGDRLGFLIIERTIMLP